MNWKHELEAFASLVLFVQVLYCTLALQLVAALRHLLRVQTRHIKHDEPPWYRTLPERAILAVLFCLLPALGWRISYGHLLSALGALYLVILLVLLLSAYDARVSLTMLLVSGVALLHVSPHFGQQRSIGGLLFGAYRIGASRSAAARQGGSHAST